MSALPSAARSSPLDRTTLLAFGGLVLLVGANPVAIRFSNRELEPFWGGGVRFAAAAVLFWPSWRQGGSPFREDGR